MKRMSYREVLCVLLRTGCSPHLDPDRTRHPPSAGVTSLGRSGLSFAVRIKGVPLAVGLKHTPRNSESGEFMKMQDQIMLCLGQPPYLVPSDLHLGAWRPNQNAVFGQSDHLLLRNAHSAWRANTHQSVNR